MITILIVQRLLLFIVRSLGLMKGDVGRSIARLMLIVLVIVLSWIIKIIPSIVV
jgi:hypothetical protein